MPTYSYIAKSLKGEEEAGVAEAKSVQQLAKTLKNQGFILIKAEPKEKGKEKRRLEISLPFFGGVSLVEKMMFTRNLQIMIASGLPLPRALETLSGSTKSKKFKTALIKVKEEIIKGKSFTESLGGYPSIFSELFQSMIKVGEESGNLDEVLTVLSQQMEREHELKSKIKGALMYPVVIILAMIGVGVLMLVMVVPKLAETFEDLGVELPATTKFVIGIGTFLAEQFFLVILIGAGLLIFLWLILKTKGGKKVIDTISLKIPIISALIRKTNSAYTVRTLTSLIASGVPLVRSLEVVAGTLGNVHYKKAMLGASEKVRKGEKLSEALKPYQDIYPSIVFQMIQVGEETGETSKILTKLADFFEEEITRATKNLTSIIEPVLMLIIGGVVGFFAISMIQPMYSMLGAL